MKPTNFILLSFLFRVSEACGDYTQCIAKSKAEVEECKKDLDCQCLEMGKQVACYELCLGDETAAEAKAHLVSEMTAQCRPLLRAGPTPVKAKLLLSPTAEPQYTRDVYYDALQFKAATDPIDYYATVAVYQSMPQPGAYSNFVGPVQMAHSPPNRTPSIANWLLLLVPAYFL